jgi:hypothetical protein
VRVFDAVVALLDAGERDDLTACLDVWAADRRLARVAENLRAEVALPAATLQLLLQRFVARLRDGESPVEAWCGACREHKRAGRVHPAPPPVLGRAVSEETMNKLVGEGNPWLDQRQVRLFMERAVTGGAAPPTPVKEAFARAPLGRFLIWATFHPDVEGRSPFADMPDDRLFVGNALGLGDPWEPPPLVLLTYERPEALALHRPTVCDAEDYMWYRPHGDAASPHGMTALVDAARPPSAGMPEVVHEVIFGATLLFPLRRAI